MQLDRVRAAEKLRPHELEPGNLGEPEIVVVLGLAQHRRQRGFGVVEPADNLVRLGETLHHYPALRVLRREELVRPRE